MQGGRHLDNYHLIGSASSLLLDHRNTFRALRSFPVTYRVADKSLARPGRKQATATEDFDVHISYL